MPHSTPLRSPRTPPAPDRPTTRQSRFTPTTHVALAGLTAVGVSFGFARYGYGLFLPQLRAEFELSTTALGAIGSATYAGYLAALLLVGLLATRLGPRPLVVTGAVAGAIGMATVALTTNPAVLIAGLVLAGTSSGFVWAPFSDAVAARVPERRRDRVLGIIASGTAFGVALAGPLAIATHAIGWRYAWLVFAAITAVVAVYNAKTLPGRANTRQDDAGQLPPTHARSESLRTRPAVPLYLAALVYGVVGSVYWAFATDLVARESASPAVAALFFTLIGLAGISAVGTGSAITRLGLGRTHVLIFAVLTAALLVLALAPGDLVAIIGSAILYGPVFMAGSGLLAVWSYRVFPRNPTVGFSATVFFIAIGTIAGPAAMGALADQRGLVTAFVLTAALSGVAALLAPHRGAEHRPS